MKTIHKLIFFIFSILLSSMVLAQGPVSGKLQYFPGSKGSKAVISIPVPSIGAPYQVKAVLNKSIVNGNEKKEARFIFLQKGEAIRSGSVFIIQNETIIADIGEIDQQNEQLKLFLIYKNPAPDQKSVFKQITVDIVR